MMTLAAGLTAFMAVGAVAEPSHQEGQGGNGKAAESEHTCPHAKAAAEANGAAAAPCDHAKEGGCASCADAKDCPHAKGGDCSHCDEKAPSN